MILKDSKKKRVWEKEGKINQYDIQFLFADFFLFLRGLWNETMRFLVREQAIARSA